MKKGIALLAIIIAIQSNAQFLDLNIFKPRVSFGGEFVHNTQASSMSSWNTGANVLIPIKGKLNFDVDWKSVLTSKSIKEAIGNVTPKAYQLFGELGYQTHSYNTPSYFGSFQTYKAGFTGVWLKYHNKKIRTLLVSGNVRYTESKSAWKSNAINPSLFVGTSVVHSLKNFVIVGGYASYFGKRLIASPVLMWYHRFSAKWSSTLILPVQAKLTWKQSQKFKQELVASYFGFNHATTYSSTVPGEYTGVNAVSGLRLSTQSKIKMGNSIDFYLEIGWQDLVQSGAVVEYNLFNKVTYDGSLFTKIRVNVAIGRALINPKIFDFGL